MPYDELRRCDTAKMSSTELAIVCVITAVESLGADTRLTQAVILLQQARAKVADYVDGIGESP